MDHRKLKENISNFSLDDCARGNQGYNRVLLQLFGYTGHGKSSFINSCKYVLEDDGEFIEHAEARATVKGLTMIRRDYELTNNITMVDNRGYNTMDNFQKAEVYAQLGNFIPLNEEVNWEDNYTAMMQKVEESEIEPNFTDFLVPILVYSAETQFSSVEMQEVKIFMDNCVKMTGVVPIVVLTHKTSGDYFECEKKFSLIGAEIVIAVENYTKEKNIKTLGRTTDILMVIYSALRDVKYRMEQSRNLRRERVERKTFLLQYIHNLELAKLKEEMKKDQDKSKEKIQVQRGFLGWIRSLFS